MRVRPWIAACVVVTVACTDRSIEPRPPDVDCAAGCEPTIVSEGFCSYHIDRDDRFIYWTDHFDGTGLRRVDKATGAQAQFSLPHARNFGPFIDDADRMYWLGADGPTNSILVADTGLRVEPAVLVQEGATLGTVRFDDDYIYWHHGLLGEFRRTPKAGGSFELVASGAPGVGMSTAIDETHFYWDDLGTIRRASKDGSAAADRLVEYYDFGARAFRWGLAGILFDKYYFYWGFSPEDYTGPTTLYRMLRTGGAVERIVDVGSPVRNLILVGAYIYGTAGDVSDGETSYPGFIFRTRTDVTDALEVVVEQDDPTSIVHDASGWLFWVDGGFRCYRGQPNSASLVKLPVPP